jgi:iron complex transport system permease protein
VAFLAVLRNPLADPYILGVSSGAAIGKAVAVLVIPMAVATTAFATPLLCFVGALVPVFVLLRLAASSRGYSPVTLLLAGAIMNLVLSAAMMLVQVFANPDNARQITYWWLGGLDVTGYLGVAVAAPVIAAGIGVLVWRAGAMNLLSIDALTASHLGLDVSREMAWLLGAGTAMAAAAVALCGPIGFAGLLVPHILRLAAGPDHRLLVPLSVISGGGFLVLCDIVGRRALPWLEQLGVSGLHTQAEIPAGVITALLGGPMFLWLLARGRG